MRAAARMTVEADPETVFDAMADARNEPQWNSRVSSAELLSGDPIGLDSKLAPVIRRDVRKQFASFKASCERR